MNRSIVAVCIFALALGACGGRRANPVSTVSITDQHMTCTEITASIMSNDSRMGALREEERRAKNSNVALGVAGALLFWPALFALDTTNTEQVEINALQSRNTYLTMLSSQRNCSAPGALEPQTQSPTPGRAPADGGAFRNCRMSDGSVSMMTPNDCRAINGQMI